MAITLTYTFTAGTRIQSAQVNSNFSTLSTKALDKTGDTMTGHLLFTDNTYDIGASGATRPRDLFLARNATLGGTLGVTGLTTVTGGLTIPSAAIFEGIRRTCEGRLTLTTATPITTADVTAAGTIYFAPYQGNKIALFDGTNWKLYTLTERSLALTITSGKNYDVFLYDSSGTLTLELSAAWTNDTTRADALTTQDGIQVKSGATTRRYLGTIRASGANTTEDSAAKRFVWNYYNRVPRPLERMDTTITWTYTTATVRQARGSADNQVAVVVGVNEVPVDVQIVAQSSNSTADVTRWVGCGLDATTVAPTTGHVSAAAGAGVSMVGHTARLNAFVGIGYHFVAWLEWSAATGTTTWYGNDTANTPARCGLSGWIKG